MMMFVLLVNKGIIMDLKEILKLKQQKQQFNNTHKQQTKIPAMPNKPQKRVTGRGR